MTDTREPAVLITIPLSHYCEKARWALDRVGVAYREEAHAPLVHRLFTMTKGGGTVPMLINGPQRIFSSEHILKWAASADQHELLYPKDAALRTEVESLEATFDVMLGPHSRRWAYAHLLEDPSLIRHLWTERAPSAEVSILKVLAPLIRRLVKSTYRITPESGARSLSYVHGMFRQVESILAEGRRYLVGERFTAADLTFAVLAAPMLLPPEYRAVQPPLEKVPTSMRDEILRMRDTVAGQFALRVFSHYRNRSAPSQESSHG